MLSEQRTGPISAAPGAVNPGRTDSTGSLVVTDGRARYAELARTGKLFFACNQAAIVPTAGLSTAAKNYTLYNPLNSGVLVEVVRCIISCTTLPVVSTTVATNVFLAGNLSTIQAAPASVASETVRNALLGGVAGVGLVYNTCTLAATPVAIRPLLSVDILTAVGAFSLVHNDEIAGELSLLPGTYISIQASAATIGLQCSMTWAETLIPV